MHVIARQLRTHVNEILLVADFEIGVDTEFVYVTDDRHIWNAVLWSGACSEENYNAVKAAVHAPRDYSWTSYAPNVGCKISILPSVTNFGRSSTDAIVLIRCTLPMILDYLLERDARRSVFAHAHS